MIPRKQKQSTSLSFSEKKESKIPLWMVTGIVLVALMGLSYAQVAGVLHHPGEIDWDKIIGSLPLSSWETDFLNGIISVSKTQGAAGSTSGINADTLDGLDSVAFQGGGSGTTVVQHDEDSPHISGDTGDLVLGVQTASPTAMGQNNDYVPLQTDSTGRLRVNADPITVNTTQDGEYYYQQCGYLVGGSTVDISIVTSGLPSNALTNKCNDGGSIHDPDLCDAGDVDLGIDCYPTDLEVWDADSLYFLTGMCQRVCQDLD